MFGRVGTTRITRAARAIVRRARTAARQAGIHPRRANCSNEDRETEQHVEERGTERESDGKAGATSMSLPIAAARACNGAGPA